MEPFLPVLITLILSALFSGIETSFSAANKLKIEVDKSRDIFSAKILSRFVNNQALFNSTIWFARIITLIVYTVSATELAENLINQYHPLQDLEFAALLITEVLAISLVYFLVAHLIPGILFRFNANNLLKLMALPALAIYVLFFPFIKTFVFISEVILKYLMGEKIEKQSYFLNTSDLDTLINTTNIEPAKDNEDRQEIRMFHNARDLSNIKVREFMVPRNEIVAINKSENLENLGNLIVESGHSKILIFDESIDNVIGYAHAYDIFAKPGTIGEILKPVIIVPGSMAADKLLSTFILERKSVALVVDEFGGTDGMLTIEDILEEIFGDIEDEYDTEEIEDSQISENEYLVSGRSGINYLNEKYNLALPESDDYQTIAGYVINIHENIPSENEEINIANYTFIIQKASESRIEEILIRVNPA
ncbi:MAG TPA: hemolysin family protein [Lentimicrobium sp.]|nr:hemolysin family protein [Lentimicrobium sp.]